MLEIARKRRRYGYRRICQVLRKKQVVNHKRVYRVYGELGLKYRRKSRKKRHQGEGKPLITPILPNERWSMDFVSDSMYNGRRFRVFNLLDDCSRESVVQHPDFSITDNVTSFSQIALKGSLNSYAIISSKSRCFIRSMFRYTLELQLLLAT